MADLERGGMKVSGRSLDDELLELIGIPTHPWFVASQFHPEFTSSPRDPQPLFLGFVDAARLRHGYPKPESVS